MEGEFGDLPPSEERLMFRKLLPRINVYRVTWVGRRTVEGGAVLASVCGVQIAS